MDLVILVGPMRVDPEWFQHTDHLEGDGADPYLPADRVDIAEQSVNRGRTDHGHPGGCRYILIREIRAPANSPVPDLRRIL